MWTLALLWGASYLFIKLGLETLEPAFIVFSRLALAGLVLIPFAARAGAFAGLRERWRAVLVLAAVQVVVPFLLITYGEEHVASGLTGVLIASAPIFTALLAFAGFGPRVQGWSLGGVVVGIVGVLVLFASDLTGSSDLVLGGAMILVASLGYSVGAVYLRARFQGVAPLGVAAASMSTAAVLTAPMAALQAPAALPSLTSGLAVVALGVLGTGIAFGIFYVLIADIGAARASVVAYLAPAFSLAYGALFVDEPITLSAIAGLVLILSGSYLAATGRAPWQRRPVAVPATA